MELSIESSKDEECKNVSNENNIKKESKEKIDIIQEQDCNLENNNIESEFYKENCNKYDSGEYVTILDILSMKHNNNNL